MLLLLRTKRFLARKNTSYFCEIKTKFFFACWKIKYFQTGRSIIYAILVFMPFWYDSSTLNRNFQLAKNCEPLVRVFIPKRSVVLNPPIAMLRNNKNKFFTSHLD